MNKDKFESQVINQIKERILTRDDLIGIVRMVNEEMDSANHSYQNELVLITDAIEDINHRLERLYDVIETGKLNLDNVVIRIRELQLHQQELQAKRIEIESHISDRKVELADLETISLYVNDLNDLLKQGSITERRAFIKSFIKEVRVTGDKAVLSHSMPILPEQVTIEKEGVLPAVHYGGRYRTIDRTFELEFILTI